jgi:deazaflavin-dependent oxidoreductase (nitroreductase family)
MNTDLNARQTVEMPRSPRLPPRLVIRAIWVLHRAVYRVTRGRFGLRMAAGEHAGYMRLTTVGRRTGTQRESILAYVDDGPNVVTLAMNGWAVKPPAWWLNLQASPDAVLVMPDGSHAVRARVAREDERPRLWAALDDKAWGDIDGFAATRSQAVPVVVFEPRP